MAARVLDFAQAHPAADDISHTGLVSRLADRVARGDALAVQQHNGREMEQAAITRRQELRTAGIREQLEHVAVTVELASPEHPELAGQFVMPKASVPLKEFATAAKTFLAAALANKDLLLSYGVGDTFLDQFSASVAEFDSTTLAAHTHAGNHVGASAELGLITNECTRIARILDGTYKARFRSDPESLAAWNSARIIIALTRHDDATTPEPDPTPVAPPVPVPAPLPVPVNSAPPEPHS
jgi:hypothetical protein